MNGVEPSPLQSMPCSTVADLNDAFDRQRQAFRRDGIPPLPQRRADLAKLARAIRRDAERIARVITADFGNRAAGETLLAEVLTTLISIRHTSRHLARWMRSRRVPVGLELMPARARIICQPLGVVGIISPWNYPFSLAIAPLAAGNRVIVKPSELTPRTSAFLAEFLGGLFPAEQVAVVQGGPQTGAEFARLPFDHLFYTGSTAVGREVMKAAAENLTPLTLELGGKSPCIIAEDADLPRAVGRIVFGKLLNAGQTCIAPDYVFIPEAARDRFVACARRAVRRLYPSVADNPDYTSIVSERHYRRLLAHVEEARASGAAVIELSPDPPPSAPGTRKIAPVLVLDPDDGLAIMREEIFGPVLPVKTYRRIEEAIDYVNNRPPPLALYYFGADAVRRDAVLQCTRSGGVTVNDTLLQFACESLPFGGVGASGLGAYHGEAGFLTFSHRRSVFLQSRISGTSLLKPPFGWRFAMMIKIMLAR
ncbi:MAG TPA: coniferyl aldehyde dehydrogenase [Stellaceae bacterium]|nr:coniferyl aldehyde dehydrogenase [Stellaceae bacterium]